MGFDVRVLADSISERGDRLTTFEATFPRLVLAEFNTHRVLSRNSASSRAIPIAKQLRRIMEDPFVPIEFGTNRPGMQAGKALTGSKRRFAETEWLAARDSAVSHVITLTTGRRLHTGTAAIEAALKQIEETPAQSRPSTWLNVHKQLANRILEPFMWHTVIVTATEWSNFFNLRAHVDAQPEIRALAVAMRSELEQHQPESLETNQWHLPLVTVDDAELSTPDLIKVCVGRCARVSYLTHDGRRSPEDDLLLHDRLLESGHMSPFEHVAKPMTAEQLSLGSSSGNFQGWHAYRKEIPGEENPLGASGRPIAVGA